jgi:hypothetical protein
LKIRIEEVDSELIRPKDITNIELSILQGGEFLVLADSDSKSSIGSKLRLVFGEGNGRFMWMEWLQNAPNRGAGWGRISSRRIA